MTSIPKSSEICVAVISPETTVTSVLTPKAEPPKHRISFRFRYLPLGGFFQNTLIFAGRVWKNSFRENLGFCSGGYLQIVVHSSSGRVLYSISPPFRSLYYSARPRVKSEKEFRRTMTIIFRVGGGKSREKCV